MHRQVLSKLVLAMIVLDCSMISMAIQKVSAANWYLQGFFNAGIEGWVTENGTYVNLADQSGVPVFSRGEFANVPGVPYPVGFAIGGIQKVGNPQNISDKLQSITGPDGKLQYYLWQQQFFSFEVLVYTKARETDFVQLSDISESINWFKYYYADCTLINWPWNWFDFFDSGTASTIKVSGKSFQGDIYAIHPSITGRVRTRIALGNSLFVHTDTLPGTNGSYVYNKTTFTLGSPRFVHGPAINTKTGEVDVVNFQVGTDQSPSKITEKNQNVTPSTQADPQDYNQLKIPDAGKDFLKNAKLEMTKVNYVTENSMGQIQSLVANETTGLIYEADGSQISGQFSPDMEMYPNPLTNAYVDIPVSMCPWIEINSFQYQVQKCSLWIGKYLTSVIPWRTALLVANQHSETVLTSRYVESMRAHNVYYIQTIKIPVYFASVYNWKPEDPRDPYVPIDPQVDFQYPPSNYTTTTTGSTDTKVEIVIPPFAFFGSMAAMITFFVAVIGLGIVVLILVFKLSSMRPDKIFMKLLSAGQQMLSPQMASMMPFQPRAPAPPQSPPANQQPMPYPQPYPQPMYQQPMPTYQPPAYNPNVFYVDIDGPSKTKSIALLSVLIGAIVFVIAYLTFF